jgi:hypothetical protein
MAIGPDVLVFISASRALLQSIRRQPLTEEEQAELASCLQELLTLLPRDYRRHAA